MFSSCKKNETNDLKDFSYYQKNFSNDKNIISMIQALSQGKNSIELVSKNSFFTAIDVRNTIKREFSKQKIDERVKIAMDYFQKFKADNPEFIKLDSDKKYELFKLALNGFEEFEQSSFSIKTLGGDCMGGFNHMANSCAKNYQNGIAIAFVDPDPIMWGVNLAANEISYLGCLNDAADAMDVCGSGGY
jgi:hypothetical protein